MGLDFIKTIAGFCPEEFCVQCASYGCNCSDYKWLFSYPTDDFYHLGLDTNQNSRMIVIIIVLTVYLYFLVIKCVNQNLEQ